MYLTGWHKLFICSHFSYTLLICLFSLIVFLPCMFHFQFFFVFISLISFVSISLLILSPNLFILRVSFSSFLLFPTHSLIISILSFLIYIFFIIAQSYPSISYVSLPRLSIYFPNFCYLFPYIMNNLVVCNPTTTTTFHPIYSAKIFQFRIAARNPSSIENMLHTSKSNLRSRFIEKRYRQRPRLSSHANSLLLVIY